MLVRHLVRDGGNYGSIVAEPSKEEEDYRESASVLHFPMLLIFLRCIQFAPDSLGVGIELKISSACKIHAATRTPNAMPTYRGGECSGFVDTPISFHRLQDSKNQPPMLFSTAAWISRVGLCHNRNAIAQNHPRLFHRVVAGAPSSDGGAGTKKFTPQSLTWPTNDESTAR